MYSHNPVHVHFFKILFLCYMDNNIKILQFSFERERKKKTTAITNFKLWFLIFNKLYIEKIQTYVFKKKHFRKLSKFYIFTPRSFKRKLNCNIIITFRKLWPINSKLCVKGQ